MPLLGYNPSMHIRRKTLDVASHSGRWIVAPLTRHYRNRYHERHIYPKAIFTLDLLLVGVLFGLAIALVTFFFFNRNAVAKHIDFSSNIAPLEISSGSPSTLVISWQNRSDEDLRDAKLILTYPDHFLLQDLVYFNEHLENRELSLGTIQKDGMGSVKIRGVMFGDIEGTQTFSSKLTFRYGDHNRVGTKETQHVFKPTSSALTIDASIPETLISEQRVRGTLHLTNHGPVDFGRITITPTDSVFDFSIASPRVARTQGGAWIVNGLSSGTSVDLEFQGRTPKEEVETEAEWSFSASFMFDETTYLQGKTTKTFHLIPSPLSLESLIDTPVLTPGDNLSISGTFRNRSDEPLTHLSFFVEGVSPFLAPRDGEGSFYDVKRNRWQVVKAPTTLAPGEEGSFRLSIPIRSSISKSSVSQYETFSASINLGAEFDVSTVDASASIRTNPVTLPISSPITLSSFGRYSTVSGDQIGRGPLPPVVGEETKYWVFWNITGTTNPLKNVEITANLPVPAHAGDKRSVSIGDVAQFDDGHVSWIIDELTPTFAPGSKTVGIAFEIAITPRQEDIGKILTLLDNIHLTATDAFTGAIVQAYGARVTTSLPNDAMARTLDHVEAL
ncbi:MAG: hypothetical protein UY81_C0064G0006 [Candidatus Giovannonibacteria bacterium GW2011_GWA2_53_7]|uniref:DUF11 domain-containing protein n=1 Tax=Candidatus Giovannonibacteria bacterium GW2011_GWA2_53_7 TaxID=1618650 RepID=A0A0G1XUQ8_9BACT|nr:MAG: hypothetical protein UY81_C0064G0006 [Candidatus Giovannonibacteria bacterium GW2011_GWA2_53_7]